MITVINRRELYATFSMQKQSEIRGVLAANGIDYTIHIINRSSRSSFGDTRTPIGRMGQNADSDYQYVICVHKKNFDEAEHLIRSFPGV